MELQPLHVVVLVAFYLAESGCEDEDLFGIVAVVLSVLFVGANPLSRASISTSQLFDHEKLGLTDIVDLGDCDHMDLNPSQLADVIFSRYAHHWSQSCRTGWNIMRHIFRISTAEWEREEMPTMLSDCIHGGGEYGSYFGHNRNLLSLWNAVQTELLTYRRQSQSDPWVSKNFDMQSIQRDLAVGADIFPRGFGGYEMKLEPCWCNLEVPRIPRACEATDGDFSNLEKDWSLLTFIAPPSGYIYKAFH